MQLVAPRAVSTAAKRLITVCMPNLSSSFFTFVIIVVVFLIVIRFFGGGWKVEGGRRIVCSKGYIGMNIEKVADDFANSLVKI